MRPGIKATSLPPIDFPPGGRDEPAVSSQGSKPVRFEEVDPQATRSLFVGNIPKNISVYDVRDSFQRYGTILVSILLVQRGFTKQCTLLSVLDRVQ